MKTLRLLLVPALMAAVPAFLAACGGGVEPQATPVPATAPAATSTSLPLPTKTSVPTATSVPTPLPTSASAVTTEPTAAPSPTQTPLPTVTPPPTPNPTLVPAPTPTTLPTQTPEPTASKKPTPTAALPARQSDIIGFELEDVTVAVGTTVTWTNRDAATHTTTSGFPEDADGIWDSPFLTQSQQFTFTFNQSGVFPYWCRVHLFMTATITVEG